jgi:glycine cleavage system aminomethyltransferase T/glycine/D-amino acid oxidase-like deaminating enzyme
MSSLPRDAGAVVIGGGIVGSSLVHHLARLGWKDLVLIDKGPLPDAGGSTGHASNFIFPVDHSKEMTRFTQDSVRQYKELGTFTESGGIEVARNEERLAELRRRMASAMAWGEPAEVISPPEIRELVPFVNTDILLGGFSCPGVGVVDSLGAASLMREEAEQVGALTVVSGAEVTGIDVERGRARGVRTSRGELRADVVVICCGVWSPRVAAMAGAAIPLTPAVHQMIDVGPIHTFAATGAEIDYPIIRDMDAMMYERQRGEDLEIGSYAHRPILLDPEEIPSLHETASPTKLAFSKEDFVPQMQHAIELMPDLLRGAGVKVRKAINGLLSLTPDGSPILGETPEVRGLWTAAAVWIKEAPGIARAVAEWMTGAEPEIDPTPSDVARFHDHQRTRTHVRTRTSEAFNKTYGIVHPFEQWSSNRGVRLSPFYPREQELGATFIETAGWERPHWYESNRGLVDEYADRIRARDAEWDARWWSPIIDAEHLAMRDRVGLVDLTAFAVFDVTGPGALDYVQRMAVNQMDVAVGRVVYTPLLAEHGGIRADLTIMRLGPDHFRVVTSGATGMAERKWFADHLPGDGSVQLHDATSGWCTLGMWGPRARELLQGVTDDDVSNEGFPFATCGWITVGTLKVLASRISYVGDLGWELYVPTDHGGRLWDLLWEEGQGRGVIPVGLGVYLTTGRLEKGYRAYGNELELEYDLVEAGLARRSVKEQDFIGKAAYIRRREGESAALLCTLTVDNHTSSSGVRRYMLGHEPVLTPDGAPIVDHKGRRSYVTSAGSGPSVGAYILLAYLPPEYARVGERLVVEYFGERYPVSVAVVGSTPLFDPENIRVRG